MTITREVRYEDIMDEFPKFMKNPLNRVPQSQQNTPDVEGYFSEAADGSQMAFWTCRTARLSEKHRHAFDEYMLVVQGEYTVYLNDREIVLHAGDEILIPAGIEQWGKCSAGTRSIHAFGGKRICAETK